MVKRLRHLPTQRIVGRRLRCLQARLYKRDFLLSFGESSISC